MKMNLVHSILNLRGQCDGKMELVSAPLESKVWTALGFGLSFQGCVCSKQPLKKTWTISEEKHSISLWKEEQACLLSTVKDGALEARSSSPKRNRMQAPSGLLHSASWEQGLQNQPQCWIRGTTIVVSNNTSPSDSDVFHLLPASMSLWRANLEVDKNLRLPIVLDRAVQRWLEIDLELRTGLKSWVLLRSSRVETRRQRTLRSTDY